MSIFQPLQDRIREIGVQESARQTGYTAGALSRVMNGRRKPSGEMLEALADSWSVSINVPKRPRRPKG